MRSNGAPPDLHLLKRKQNQTFSFQQLPAGRLAGTAVPAPRLKELLLQQLPVWQRFTLSRGVQVTSV